MPVRATLGHPFGLTLLMATFLLAAAMRFLPMLERWSAQVPWVLAWGLLAYAATVIALRRSPAGMSGPELRKLQSIRRAMEARLAERRAAEGSKRPSELTRILSEAIRQLDEQVEPALYQLLERQRVLSGYLLGIEKGSLPEPGRDVLERLRAIHARQRAATEECVQQAANAAGTLVALLQEGDDARIAGQARTWAKDLLTLYDAIAGVLRGEREEEEIGELIEQSGTEGPGLARALRLSPGETGGNGASPDGFPRLVQDALRHLNDPSTLSRCELIGRLPDSLVATRARCGDAQGADSTPLRQSQALREVLCDALEGLKPAIGDPRRGSPKALQYHILYEEYVRGMSTASIMVRHGISESTFHRQRREAISAIARELRKQEELLRRELRQ